MLQPTELPPLSPPRTPLGVCRSPSGSVLAKRPAILSPSHRDVDFMKWHMRRELAKAPPIGAAPRYSKQSSMLHRRPKTSETWQIPSTSKLLEKSTSSTSIVYSGGIFDSTFVIGSPKASSTWAQTVVADETTEMAWANTLFGKLPSMRQKLDEYAAADIRIQNRLRGRTASDWSQEEPTVTRLLPTRMASKSLARVQSIESNVSSQNLRRSTTRKNSIETASNEDLEEFAEESLPFAARGSTRNLTTSQRVEKGPISLPFMAVRWRLPLDCLQDSAELFKKYATLEGAVKDEDILRDGRLHFDELIQIAMELTAAVDGKELPDHMISGIRAEVDKNADGVVDFREFAEWYHTRAFMTYVTLTQPERSIREVARKLGISCADMDHYKALFEKYDLNKNNRICLEEFSGILPELMKVPPDSKMPTTRILHFWNECDRDGSGSVNLEEFVRFYIHHFDVDSTSPMEEFYRSIRTVSDL